MVNVLCIRKMGKLWSFTLCKKKFFFNLLDNEYICENSFVFFYLSL